MSAIGDRRDDVFGNAVADQFAVERDIVVVADDDDLGAGIADLGELRSVGEQSSRRRGAIPG